PRRTVLTLVSMTVAQRTYSHSARRSHRRCCRTLSDRRTQWLKLIDPLKEKKRSNFDSGRRAYDEKLDLRPLDEEATLEGQISNQTAVGPGDLTFDLCWRSHHRSYDSCALAAHREGAETRGSEIHNS